jgi:ribosomal protein L37E
MSQMSNRCRDCEKPLHNKHNTRCSACNILELARLEQMRASLERERTELLSGLVTQLSLTFPDDSPVRRHD